MKTKIISKLKKELLLAELPEIIENDYTLTHGRNPVETYISFNKRAEFRKPRKDEKLADGIWMPIGLVNTIKEEDVSEFLKQSIFTSLYGHYVSGIDVNTYCYKNALESFNSALESEIYFNGNPFENPDMKKGRYIDRFGDIYLGKYEEDFKKWKEAQEKTFDKKRTLIFVKN